MTFRTIAASLLCVLAAFGQPAFDAQVKSHLDKGDFIGSMPINDG